MKTVSYNQTKNDYKEQEHLNTNTTTKKKRKITVKILMKSAPTLKRSQNGRFTPILYMFSLCHFQVQSEWMRLWDSSTLVGLL